MAGIPSELLNRLVRAVTKIPASAELWWRNGLLDGIPDGVVSLLERSEDPGADLEHLFGGLNGLGRLPKTGERPLVIVAGNALREVSGSVAGEEFRAIIAEVETYYGGESGPDLEAENPSPERLLCRGKDWRLPFEFIEGAVRASRAVARLKVPRILSGKRDGEHAFGTGWLIAPGLLLTNHHVIDARDLRVETVATDEDLAAQAKGTEIWFDYHAEGKSQVDEFTVMELVAKSAFDRLDYALLRFEPGPEPRQPLELAGPDVALQPDGRLNIVQHPGGGELKFAIRNNYLIEEKRKLIRYLTDTESGSSGSPIFNDGWKVVGMHHASKPIEAREVRGERIKFLNQGIRIGPILEDLGTELREEIAEGAADTGDSAAESSRAGSIHIGKNVVKGKGTQAIGGTAIRKIIYNHPDSDKS